MSSSACRKAFGNQLIALAEKDKSIVALCSDSRGSSSMAEFGQRLPEQLIEVGIAEQDEVGIAAGLAAVGFKPFVCAPACFLSARSLEQVKVDVVYSQKNVKIFGVSGGVSYGALGFTHHSTHDIAVMSCFPRLSIILPSDATQTAEVVKCVARMDMPAYIRVGRGAVEDIYQQGYKGKPFVFGKANVLNDGKDLTIIACGEMVAPSLVAARELAIEGISAKVLDMATIKPLDVEAIRTAVAQTGAVLTVEEHSIYGGLGAAVCQEICKYGTGLVSNIAFPDEFLYNGSADEIKQHYGLDAPGIIKKAKELLERKKHR
jgi:transketolase